MPSMFKSKPLQPSKRSPIKKRKIKQSSSSDEDNTYQPDGAMRVRQAPTAQMTNNSQASSISQHIRVALEAGGTRLRFAVDIGTYYTKMCFQFYEDGDESKTTQIWHISWQSSIYETPTLLCYRDGALHWGQQIENWLQAGEILESDVFRTFKLALSNDVTVRDIKNNIEALLMRKKKTLNQLFLEYVHALVTEAKARISATSVGAAYDFDTMQLDLCVSVPQAWQPASNMVLTEAARALGYRSCKVVGEALCVAAFMLEKEVNLPIGKRWLQAGDMVLVLDLGGGTGDFLLAELCDPVANGPRFGMKVARPATGSLCGAVFINRNFVHWLRTQYFPQQKEGLMQTAGSLGFADPEDFLARASQEFEGPKRAFPLSARYAIQVHGKAGYRELWGIAVTKQQMESFFDPVVDAIDVQVDHILDDAEQRKKVKAFILSGGLGKSDYIIDHMKKKWEKGIRVLHPIAEHRGPVVEGALMRYGTDLVDVGEDWSFCTMREETFDPKIHKDAVADQSLVKKDCVDSSWGVEDRCVWLINKVNGKTQECWSQRYPTIVKGQPIVLRAEIFWSTRQDIQDHEPLYKPHITICNAGIQKFGEAVCTIHDHASRGWPIVTAANGEKTYELFACVMLRWDGDFLRVGFKIVGDGSHPFDEDGKLVDESQTPWEEAEFSILHDRRFSQVTMEADPMVIEGSGIALDTPEVKEQKVKEKKAQSEELFVSADELEDDEEFKPEP